MFTAIELNYTYRIICHYYTVATAHDGRSIVKATSHKKDHSSIQGFIRGD